jgi:hypothetical protein
VRREDATHRMKRPGRADSTAETRLLLVPARLARLIPDDTEFQPELTADGILYRVVKPGTPAPAAVLPAWLNGEAP